MELERAQYLPNWCVIIFVAGTVLAEIKEFRMLVSNKLTAIIGALALPVLVATAQDAPKEAAKGPEGPRGRGGFARPERRMPGGPGGMGMERAMQAGGPIFMRMLSRPEMMKELGLPEETVAKLTEGLKKLEEQEKALREERENLMKAQADLMASLMSDRTKNGDDVRKSIAEIEALQGKLFAINIDRMLLVRDNLTDEQIKQASELVKKRFESRRDEMMKRRGGEMGRREGGRRGPEGRGPQPGPKAAPEAGDPPPPPPAEAAPAQDAQ